MHRYAAAADAVRGGIAIDTPQGKEVGQSWLAELERKAHQLEGAELERALQNTKGAPSVVP
jgi:hypothetical protein